MNDLSILPTSAVCLVRHGQTILSSTQCYNGLKDIPLTIRGESQAKCLAPVLGNVNERCLVLLLIAGLDSADERGWLTLMLGKIAELGLVLLLIAGLDGADLDDPLRVLFAVNSGPVDSMIIRTSASKVILFFVCVDISWSTFKIKVNKTFLIQELSLLKIRSCFICMDL